MRYLTLTLRGTAALLALTWHSVSHSSYVMAEQTEIVIDTVAASVNGAPITLSEVCQRMNPQRKLSPQEAALNPEAKYTLDVLILEQLIEQEAASRSLDVTNGEVERYISQVAARNNLTLEEFEAALREENRELADYKHQIRIDILKSKLASNLMRGGGGVTNDEIEAYVKDHPELSKSGAKIKLSQIFVSSAGRSSGEAKQLIQRVHQELVDGEDFDDLARKYSESAEGEKGGSLGVLAEEDLSREIFDSVFGLEEEQYSAVTESAAGYHIFFVEERYVEETDNDKSLHAEVKKNLEEQKLQSKMQTYFTTELFKLHSVDKKI